MTEVELLLVAEVAARLRVSQRTVYRLISRKELAATRVGCSEQGGLRIAADEVTSFLKRRQQPAAQPA
jgi:excisionase family DNA binding protein